MIIPAPFIWYFSENPRLALDKSFISNLGKNQKSKEARTETRSGISRILNDRS